MQNDSLWKSVLGELELSVSQAAFKTWFTKTKLIDRTEDNLIVSVPNYFAVTQFEQKYDKDVKAALKNQNVEAKNVKYVIESNHKKNANSAIEAVVSRQEQLSSTVAAPLRVSESITRPADHTGLNPKYTFYNFIVGSSNDLAATACQAVAENPGQKYNPLFLYGGVGLGKTHLMQAVGNEIVKNNPSTKVLYVTTENFTSDFLNYIRFNNKKNQQSFASKYRNVDVLIVDDMQFITNKEKTQEEFFHTFNELHQNNKQIIISSDRPPKSIPTLTDRLRSRFEWGMAIDIQMPDFETRCAIISAKASMSGVTLDRETIEYLAQNIKTNIRELEGSLNQLLAYSEMRGVKPDVTIAEGLIENVQKTRPRHLTSKQVIDKTAKIFGITSAEICSSKRDKHIALPRQIAMYLLRSELHLSFPKIATELGRKDHTTAIHSVNKIEKEIKLNFTIRQQIEDIRERLYG